MLITKSDFLTFQHCKVNFWFSKYKPDVLVKKPLSDFERQIINQGHEVESWSRELFKDGELVDVFGKDAIEMTRQKIINGIKTIFQATFSGDGLFAMTDIINWNESLQAWDIYEVKATTSKQKKKAEHYWDIAFQREVLERSNEKVGRLFLVELNKEHLKNGAISAEDLIKITDLTEEIDTMRIEIQTEIGTAKKTLALRKEPTSCGCIYESLANQCAAFSYLYPNIPAYSIYNIARIGSSKKKLAALVDADIFAIKDIPADNDLSPIQSNQVFVHNMDTDIFKVPEIKKELEKLVYPIYFLDYETIPTAIPLYDNCYPFQQVPFQYSLHIQDTPTSDLRHCEFLHLDQNNPIPYLVKQLRHDIGNKGSVIIWNKSFEGTCNKDMALQVPEHADFLLDINKRMYDLEDIFKKQLYVRKEFLGKTSIKNVLPVLAEHLNYKVLNIQDGGTASSSYKQMIWDSQNQKDQTETAKDLLAYCKLDTLAMVEILKHIQNRLD